MNVRPRPLLRRRRNGTNDGLATASASGRGGWGSGAPASGGGGAWRDAPASGGRGWGEVVSCAPLGRRLCEVVENRESGGYRVVALRDREGPEPEPGQFYMLAAERHWEERGGRPFLPRALSVADVAPLPVSSPLSANGADKGELTSSGGGGGDASGGGDGGGMGLEFLLEAVGPGTERLCGLEVGERVWVNGPLGNGFSAPRELAPAAAGAILVGGGIGIAPLALLRRRLAARGVPAQILLGFRDRAAFRRHRRPLLQLPAGARLRRRPPRRARLRDRPARRDARGRRRAQRRRLRLRAAGDAGGGGGDVRGARRRLRAGARVADGLRLRRLLRLRRPETRRRLRPPLRRRPRPPLGRRTSRRRRPSRGS